MCSITEIALAQQCMQERIPNTYLRLLEVLKQVTTSPSSSLFIRSYRVSLTFVFFCNSFFISVFLFIYFFSFSLSLQH